jgi:outer membrane protein TolC
MKHVLMLCVLIVPMALGQTVEQLSIEDAIRIAKENSKALKISEAKEDAASAKAHEAKSVMLPSLKFDGSYRRLSDIVAFTLPAVPPVLLTPTAISPNIPNTYNLKVGLQQPLFTGFRLKSNAEAAGYLADATEEDRKGNEADLVTNVISAYWMLFQANETKKFVDENVDRIASYQSDTENLLKAGLATRNDILKIRVQLSNAKLAQIDAANDVDVAMMSLNNVMGQDVGKEIHLTSTPTVVVREDSLSGQMIPVTPMPQLVASAMQKRPDLLAMESRVRAAEAGVTAAKGGWWPQIGLIANYYYNRPNQRYLPAQDEFKGTWEVGVGVQFDIWNWGATLFQTEQAQAQLHQTEYALAQLKDNATLEIKRYTLGVERAAKRIDVAREAISQAEENSRSTNEKYKNGLATSTDLLDASVALLQARTNYTGALVEHEVAVARLNKALGD